MTREEAIKYLKEMKDECNDTFHKVRYVTQEEVLEMAIQALSQEPCDDAISREDMMDAIGHGTTYTSEDLQRIIKNLPSVNPQPCDDGNNLCNSCTNIGCEFQSGIVRTKCAFYMPPQQI